MASRGGLPWARLDPAPPTPPRWIRSLVLAFPLRPPHVARALPLRLPAHSLDKDTPTVVEEPPVAVLEDGDVEDVPALAELHEEPALLPRPRRVDVGVLEVLGAGGAADEVADALLQEQVLHGRCRQDALDLRRSPERRRRLSHPVHLGHADGLA